MIYMWSVCHCIQHVINSKSRNCKVIDSDALLTEEINCFFACFEVQPKEPDTTTSPVINESFTVHDVRCVFRGVNPKKAAGSDSDRKDLERMCQSTLWDLYKTI